MPLHRKIFEFHPKHNFQNLGEKDLFPLQTDRVEGVGPVHTLEYSLIPKQKKIANNPIFEEAIFTIIREDNSTLEVFVPKIQPLTKETKSPVTERNSFLKLRKIRSCFIFFILALP